MTSTSLDDYLNTFFMGTMSEYDVLSDLFKLCLIASVVDAPASCSIPQRKYDVVLFADGENLVKMFDEWIFTLVYQHESTCDRTTFGNNTKDPFFPAEFLEHGAVHAVD